MASPTERTSLLLNQQHRRCHKKWCPRSKAAILILVWNFMIVTCLDVFLDPILYSIKIGQNLVEPQLVVTGVAYGLSALLFLFYPLAGCLADVRWGRHKTVVNSLRFIFWILVIISLLGGLALAGFLPVILEHSSASNSSLNAVEITTIVSLSVTFGPAIVFGILLIICCVIAFRANVIQFGIDQLQDAPSNDSVLFICWYIFTSYLGRIPARILFPFMTTYNIHFTYITFLAVDVPIIVVASPILGISLCVQRYKKRWFLIDSKSWNPYKLVYNVLKFANEHKTPIRRSAFTYCEDDIPSRLDLGKKKYGGPFTAEGVEDVKAFVGILCILLTLGPILMVDIAVNGVLPYFAVHTDIDMEEGINNALQTFLLVDDTLTPLLIAIFIPFYLLCLQHFFHKSIPGMLKRIGLGMIFIIFSALCTLSMDTFGHVYDYRNATCFISKRYPFNSLNISVYYLSIQSAFNALGYMLLYIAIFEFVCAQSPRAMKGLIIGTLFAIKAVFQLLGIIILFTPFTQWNLQLVFPSCGFVYYLINIVIGVAGLVAFTIVARRYQYRQRDEPDNIYRYAEEYYTKSDGQHSDNEDYDDLDITAESAT